MKDTVLQVSLLAVLAACLAAGNVRADDPDTFSPVVSYQYYDEVGSDTNTTIVSPVVSFQYFDWPGDSNLTFQTSALVSYSFEGPPQIVQQPRSQAVKVGANAQLSVTAVGTPPYWYQWRRNGGNVQPNASILSITNVQVADAGYYSVIVGNGYGMATSTLARLTIYTSPPVVEPIPPTPLPTDLAPPEACVAPPSACRSSQLMVRTGNGQIDPGKITVILTHGWNAGPGDWPNRMYGDLKSKDFASSVNIAAWDWHEDAGTGLNLPLAASQTPKQGTGLGKELLVRLGSGYSRPIHFIGHSLGTIVNCYAADYLHAAGFSPANTHMTLFDEAELASLTELDRWKAWYKVIPRQAAWIDNYISAVGISHSQAANVFLYPRESLNPADLHAYSYKWYSDSILNPLGGNLDGTIMGHYWSFEKYTMGGGRPAIDTYFMQSVLPGFPELSVAKISVPIADELNELDTRLLIYTSREAYLGLSYLASSIARPIMNGYLQGVLYAGDLVAGILEGIPEGSQPVYSGIAGSTPAYFLPPGSTLPTQANWDLQFSIQSGTAPLRNVLPAMQPLSLTPMDLPAVTGTVYVSLPMVIPADATGMSFEFRLDGAGTNEYFVMGIETDKCFVMESVYLQDGEWNSSGTIDVSTRAGQQVTAVFALNGNDPPMGTLSVRGINFRIPAPPALDIAVTGQQPQLSWPMSAAGWLLERTSSLTDSNSWTAVSNAPAVTNYQYNVLDDPGRGPMFYRLRK